MFWGSRQRFSTKYIYIQQNVNTRLYGYICRNLYLFQGYVLVYRGKFIYSLEKCDRISRWNKVSTISKKEEKKKTKRFIRNDYSREKTYNGKHNVKGDENT